ncbi:DUF2789 domain-containing protein [Rheinheimera nanhaiensis]|uniref:DUF2789 domain-containing protein n=1 Tax=Rheinheimera nanhaiensis E407-8 TaxID=562729 RepID=I1E1S2_9GAMM|nr:DUF2789 domain-containing protein [Rheinheimera nanhaiensis]GAB60250.1 hypothetical protein RNAN_3269 [Rheinheimera nanhaiensis E407-8]
MHSTTPTLNSLFAQLGLDSSDQDISRFIHQHKLAAGMAIQDAPFWNSAQASFLRESLKQDADWCEVIDELNALLH